MNLKQLIKAGLTVRDGYVLDQLTTSDDIMMTDLSGGIMAKAHITQVVDKLVQLRLVVRHRQKGDRRRVYCKLTEKGKAFTQEANSVWAFCEKHGLTKEDYDNYVNDMQNA
jgi:DNA-binding MarR family transcriptional regulator